MLCEESTFSKPETVMKDEVGNEKDLGSCSRQTGKVYGNWEGAGLQAGSQAGRTGSASLSSSYLPGGRIPADWVRAYFH